VATPNFSTALDVRKFLESSPDNWYRPMVKEYIELCCVRATKPVEEFDDKKLDVEELNGWIDHEMQSLTEGYEEWYNGNG
jgi:hypothetical protein